MHLKLKMLQSVGLLVSKQAHWQIQWKGCLGCPPSNFFHFHADFGKYFTKFDYNLKNRIEILSLQTCTNQPSTLKWIHSMANGKIISGDTHFYSARCRHCLFWWNCELFTNECKNCSLFLLLGYQNQDGGGAYYLVVEFKKYDEKTDWIVALCDIYCKQV